MLINKLDEKEMYMYISYVYQTQNKYDIFNITAKINIL